MDAGDSQTLPERAQRAQLPHQTAKLPHTPSFYPENSTPAELIRTVATLLATLGIGNRNYQTFATADVIEMRAQLALVYDSLETSGQRYELTAQGRHALERSVNDRGPLAKARHDSTQRDDAAWEAWVKK
jgi:hypothetical protein